MPLMVALISQVLGSMTGIAMTMSVAIEAHAKVESSAAPDASESSPPQPSSGTNEPSTGLQEEDEGGFFDPDKTEVAEDPPSTNLDATGGAVGAAASGTAPPMPEIEQLPSREGVPPMPEVEQLPSRDGQGKRKRSLFDRTPPSPDREPAGAEGGSFFDPGKLEDSGPSGGTIQIRGYISTNFFVTMRTNTLVREDDGTFQRLDPQPFFDVSSATLYIGAPIFADVVYARIALEYLSIPQAQVSTSQPDIIAQANRQLFFESAALEVNPLTWAKKSKRWLKEGFKITAGVFILPFGLEDEEHAAPANWFIGRPRSMTSGRVYPGTWNDVGVSVKWKPTFREQKPIRPVEIDVGIVNGDPCTQTRFINDLFQPNQNAFRCPRLRRPGEVDDGGSAAEEGVIPVLPINSGFFGIAPDNNNNKSVFTRVQVFPLPALNIGGSFVWGKHPEAVLPAPGETPVELEQAPSWRVGGHVDVNFDDIFASKIPLPMVRGEVVYGVDRAIDLTATADRQMLGGYVQIAQMLFRRKRTRLPGLFLQYRFDQADPTLAVPGVVNGVPLLSDFGDLSFAGDPALQGHTVGLRFPVLPRVLLKTEYTFVREDGGATNQLDNDLFGLEFTADF